MSDQPVKPAAFPWWQGKDEDGGLVYGVEVDADTGTESAVVVADTSREDGDTEKESANAAAIVAHAKQAQMPTVPRAVADRLAEAAREAYAAMDDPSNNFNDTGDGLLMKRLADALAEYRKAVS